MAAAPTHRPRQARIEIMKYVRVDDLGLGAGRQQLGHLCRRLSPVESVDARMAVLSVSPYPISTCGSCLGCTTMATKIGGGSGK
jgi:hypothetical protein